MRTHILIDIFTVPSSFKVEKMRCNANIQIKGFCCYDELNFISDNAVCFSLAAVK